MCNQIYTDGPFEMILCNLKEFFHLKESGFLGEMADFRVGAENSQDEPRLFYNIKKQLSAWKMMWKY